MDPRVHRRARRVADVVRRDLAELPAGRIATVVGRYYAMDRDQRWERTQLAIDAITDERCRCTSTSPQSLLRCVQQSYDAGTTDEFLLPIVVEGTPRLDPAKDAAVFFNFRPDRARQLAIKLLEARVDLTTMTRYRDDLDAPVAFEEQDVVWTLAEVLASHDLRQLHCAETEKYAHVTYFFNGGREEEWPGENRLLIPSPRDVPSYDHKPEMSAAQVTEEFCRELDGGGYAFAVVNFANPDMVGHTGVIPAVVQAVETVDECLARVVETVDNLGGVCLVTADHGNAETMFEADGTSPHTAHTTNPVPLVVTAAGVALREGGGLRDLAPTTLGFLGLDDAGGDDRDESGRHGLNPAILPRPLSLAQPDFGVLRKAQRGDEARLLADPPGLRDAGLQLRAPPRRRPPAGRGSDAGGVPAGLPGPAELLAPLEVHDLALPGHEEPRARRAPRQRASAAATVALDDAPPLEVLDAPFERLEAIDAVWRAVENLNVDLKMALLLRDVVGLSYTEIADSLEITLATVKWRIYKAREEVQLALAREGIRFGSADEAKP